MNLPIEESIIDKIYIIRNEKVMLDNDLAALYKVETKALKQAVKRNLELFPNHFMFELSDLEEQFLRSQFVTSKSARGGNRYTTMAFTEYGALQLASILRSDLAKKMSIKLIEVFIQMRKKLNDNMEMRVEIEGLKTKIENNSKNIELVFSYLDELMEKQVDPIERTPIGFKL